MASSCRCVSRGDLKGWLIGLFTHTHDDIRDTDQCGRAHDGGDHSPRDLGRGLGRGRGFLARRVVDVVCLDDVLSGSECAPTIYALPLVIVPLLIGSVPWNISSIEGFPREQIYLRDAFAVIEEVQRGGLIGISPVYMDRQRRDAEQ